MSLTILMFHLAMFLKHLLQLLYENLENSCIIFCFHYATFFVLVLVSFCLIQILFSAPYFQRAWINIIFFSGEIPSVISMKASNIIVCYNRYVLHPVLCVLLLHRVILSSVISMKTSNIIVCYTRYVLHSELCVLLLHRVFLPSVISMKTSNIIVCYTRYVLHPVLCVLLLHRVLLHPSTEQFLIKIYKLRLFILESWKHDRFRRLLSHHQVIDYA
jgi:hypothetical protein